MSVTVTVWAPATAAVLAIPSSQPNGWPMNASAFSGWPGAPAGQLVAMMRAVVEARAHRYLMLDAPEERVDEICDVIGSRSPSVIPLAEPGMVAVHALVPATDVWQLLPRLEAVGAFSILVVPVERMLR